jgi:CpeT protein
MKKLILLLLLPLSLFGQVKLSPTDMEEYVTRISGKFSTRFNQTIDSTKDDVMVRTIVFQRYPDVIWLYTQQGEFLNGKYYPYRQRVYAVEQMDEYYIKLTIYGFKNDADYYGVLDDTTSSLTPQEWLQNIPSDGLIVKDGCEITIWKDNLNAFRGSTTGKDCKGSFNGATYTTSEFVIYQHEVISWERGWDDKGNQKWGPKKTPYIYSKVEQY